MIDISTFFLKSMLLYRNECFEIGETALRKMRNFFYFVF